jgi:hypothetical protein
MTDNEMEATLTEMARIESLKGPRNPTRAQQYFQPAPPTPEQLQAMTAQADRQERAARPAVLPSRPEPNFLEDKRAQMQRDARKEQLIAATGSRLE